MKLVEWQNPMEKLMEGAKDMTLNNVDALFQSLELTKQFNFGEDLSEEEKSELKEKAVLLPLRKNINLLECAECLLEWAKKWYNVYVDYYGYTKVYSVDIKNLDDACRLLHYETVERYDMRKEALPLGKKILKDPLKQEDRESFVRSESWYVVKCITSFLKDINKEGKKDWEKINDDLYRIYLEYNQQPFYWFKEMLMRFSNDPDEVNANLVDLHNR